jgi:hypothetical protein
LSSICLSLEPTRSSSTRSNFIKYICPFLRTHKILCFVKKAFKRSKNY